MGRREDSKQMICQCSSALCICENPKPHQTCLEVFSKCNICCIPSTHHCQMESWNSVWDGRAAERETVLFSHPHSSAKQPLIHAPTRQNRIWKKWALLVPFTDGIKKRDLEELPKIYKKCQSTCSNNLRPDKNLEELNTWPLSSCFLNSIGFRVRKDKSCQLDLL